MKLYATVTSERATKGQGGQWLDIEIRNSKKRLLGVIKVNQWGEESARIETNFAPDVMINLDFPKGEQPKGKRQKGEICPICGKRHKNALCSGGMR